MFFLFVYNSIVSTRVCVCCLIVCEHEMICVYVCINVQAKLMYRKNGVHNWGQINIMVMLMDGYGSKQI